MEEAAPISKSERIEVLDVLRGLAVCGILIGNMQWFSGYGMTPPVFAKDWSLYNQVTNFLVHFLIEGKFYSIFSFLFETPAVDIYAGSWITDVLRTIDLYPNALSVDFTHNKAYAAA